jgi:gas vesicle protein
MNIRDSLQQVKEQLQQQRDELAVQISLAKMEAREEWEVAETKFAVFRAKLDEAADEAKDAAGDVMQSAAELGEELKRAYERVKSKL